MKKLNVQTFIKEHENWEEILNNEPYCLEIKHDNMFGRELVLLKYNMITSDFSLDIVKECRGLILDANTLEPISFPFTKFFNFGEIYAATIDWSTAVVSQKIDGSIIKIVKISSHELLISTNGNIDAFKANLAEQVGCTAESFGDLVLQGIAYYGLDSEKLASMLECGKTYIFELVSPFSKVVIHYPETKLYLIGIRDNTTFVEEKFEEHKLAKIFDIPKIYHLKNIDECIAAAAELPDDEEGYVVRDDNFNRVKCKSQRYLELHRLHGNGVLSIERALEIVKANEQDEVILYFPEFKPALDEVKSKYEAFAASVNDELIEFKKLYDNGSFIEGTRKEYAKYITSHFIFPAIGFQWLDGKVSNAKEWLDTAPLKSVLKAIGITKEENKDE